MRLVAQAKIGLADTAAGDGHVAMIKNGRTEAGDHPMIVHPMRQRNEKDDGISLTNHRDKSTMYVNQLDETTHET